MPKTKKFSLSMPEDAYENYKAKAKAAGLSFSSFLYRAGSITSVEEAVMFPLTNQNAGAAPISTNQNNFMPKSTEGKVEESK